LLLAEDLVEFFERALEFIAALAGCTRSAGTTGLRAGALGPVATGAALTAFALRTVALALCAALAALALAARARLLLTAGAAPAVLLLTREAVALARRFAATTNAFLPTWELALATGESGLTASSLAAAGLTASALATAGRRLTR
jgi:hypothetical protein